MVVNQIAINSIKEKLSNNQKDLAVALVEIEAVNIKNIKYKDESNFSVRAIVNQSVGLKVIENIITANVVNNVVSEYSCTCGRLYCDHTLATLIELDTNEKYQKTLRLSDTVKENIKLQSARIEREEQEKRKKRINRTANSLIEGFKDNIKYKIMDDSAYKNSNSNEKSNVFKDVNIIPKLEYCYGDFNLSFQIGTKQLYKIKDLVEFKNNIKRNKLFKYGVKLVFEHKFEVFTEESKPVINYILKYAENIELCNEYMQKSRYSYYNLPTNKLVLTNDMLDELFDILDGKNILYNDKDKKIDLKAEVFSFDMVNIGNEEYQLRCDAVQYFEFFTKNYVYFLKENTFSRIKKDVYILTLIKNIQSHNSENLVFTKETLPDFFSVVYPKISKYIRKFDIETLEKYIPPKLCVKVYLDLDEENSITATLKFVYGDTSFNPYKDVSENIIRDFESEIEVGEDFEEAGFLQTTGGKLVLLDENLSYEFLTEKIGMFLEKYEVLASEKFKTKKVKQAKISNVGIKIENNLIDIDLKEINIDLKELKDVLESYNLKKKYYKLKDGTFLNMNDNKDLDTLNEITESLDISFKMLENGKLKLPIYRSMYLDRLLEKNDSITVVKDSNFRNLINDIENSSEIECSLPKRLNADLRTYQENGYKWLKSLDAYGFGGILADDMGLGKTIQVITLIQKYVEENKKTIPSIVVCPSSLVLNWENEIRKFANNLKTFIVSGNFVVRQDMIKDINKYDVIITSYDTLKRDIDTYNELGTKFKYIIADEAQYIKNANTQNSKALKMLNGNTKFALTGTPIENSLSELWSIFDYIMPSYLYSYGKFKNNFESPIIREEDSTKLERLKELIKPFVLRRIKKDVLTELPDKVISVLENQMENEQIKIYNAHLAMAKEELSNEIQSNGFEKSQIKILALINRLRQICCHPSLFIENYKGESSKLEQCIELIKDATESNHKILLFSSYTSIFDILRKRLDKEKIKYFELTGRTKISERIELVDKFNADENVKVFLISLKAGGTGLNLTGADMVIHFDPWWNLSAENQATDRAYRIGQKNNVQVYKLITKDSIEEKIFELQEKKAKLVDNMLTSEETFINKLSKEDILSLFD